VFYDNENPFFSGDELLKYLEEKGSDFKLVMMNSNEKQAFSTFIQFKMLKVPFAEADVQNAMKDEEKA
jgi:hypothetical protein